MGEQPDSIAASTDDQSAAIVRAGEIGHDLNNLLAVIMNFAGLASVSLREEMTRLGLDYDGGLATVAQDIEEITRVAKRAATFTHELLVLSHPDRTANET